MILLRNLAVMRLFVFLPIFIHCRGTGQDIKSTSFGDFTILQKPFVEKSRNRKNDYETKSYLLEYSIQYKGKHLKLPSLVKNGEQYDFPWRVFVVNSNNHALLACSQEAILISATDGKPSIKKITNYNTDFVSLQWLGGDKAGYIEIHDLQNDNMIDSSLSLQEGNYLLINNFTLLNTDTLELFAFNPKGNKTFDGYSLVTSPTISNESVIGFSDKHTQIVFRALKLREDSDGAFDPALISFDFLSGRTNIVPFRLFELGLENLDEINSQWFYRNFEWDSVGMLQLIKSKPVVIRTGKLNFADKNFISYSISPVTDQMIKPFLDFVREEYPSVDIIDVTDKRSTRLDYTITINKLKFQLSYYTDENKLVFDRHFSDDHVDEHTKVITSISVAFDNLLKKGKYSNYFQPKKH